MKKGRKKESISLEEFALILADLKFGDDHIIKQYDGLCAGLEGRYDKFSDTHFLEYLIFDLFTDHACFLLAFSQEVADMLFEIYCMNIWIRLLGKGYKVNPEEFMVLFNERAAKYRQYLKEYDPKHIGEMDINKYPLGLGKAFSMNFIGHKDPAIFCQADLMFVSKIKSIYGSFLKDIVEKYEIVLPSD